MKSFPFFKRLFVNPHVIILCITTCLALIYYSWDINSWKFAFVGDEWPFFDLAKELVTQNFLRNPFDFHGVYSQNTILSSMYQALFLKIFGFSHIAWRFSNIILIIPITILFYQWLKKLFNPTTALYATILLQSSYYLANFLKIGKNMPQALALMVACLCMAVYVSEKPSKTNFFILGVLLGVSFYIYIGPIFPLIIWPFLIPLLQKKTIRQTLFNSIFLILAYGFLLLPALLQIAVWNGPLEKTIAKREYTDNKQILVNIFNNFFLFYASHDYIYNHFVAGPYLDIISRIFAFIGTVISVVKTRKNNFLYLLLSYICLCFIIGITSPYPYSPTTRGLFFVPFGAAFAGIGLYYLGKHLPKHAIIATFIIVFLVNFYFSQVGVFKLSGYSRTTLIFKEIQQAKELKSNTQIVLLLSDKHEYNPDPLDILRKAYKLESVPYKIVRISQLQCADVTNAKVLILQDDPHALSRYTNLNCPDSHILEIINYSIPL